MINTRGRTTLRIIATLWALPNSLVGLVYGGVGLCCGARHEWDASGCILRFVDMPSWLMPTAISLGHVQVYAGGRCKRADGSPAANRFGVPGVIRLREPVELSLSGLAKQARSLMEHYANKRRSRDDWYIQGSPTATPERRWSCHHIRPSGSPVEGIAR